MPDTPSIPAVPDTSLPEKKRGRPVGATSKKSKADDMENEAYTHIMGMYKRYNEIKDDKEFQDKLKADPYLAVALTKELNQISKRILDITIAKLRIEELKSQKATEAGGDGAKNVFIIQGLYDSNAPKTIEVTTDDGPVKFQTKGLEA